MKILKFFEKRFTLVCGLFTLINVLAGLFLSLHSIVLLFSALFFFIVSLVAASKFHIEFKAKHDFLTGLPNRAYFYEEIEKRIANKKTTPLFLLDLNGFKQVNDTLGHHAGDELLKMVAARLRDAAHQYGTSFRLGGDEFAVILRCKIDPIDYPHIAQKILGSFNEPFKINGINVDSRPSIGISIYPEHANSVVDLVKRADIALYKAKKERAGYKTFLLKDATDQSPDFLSLYSDIKHAIEKNEFEIYFQPKKSLRSGRITGVEALIRWNHPRLGLLSPDRFIPIAEQIGVINLITEWVIKNSIDKLLIWKKLGLKLTVSINISADNLKDSNILSIVTNEIERTDVDLEDLIFEVTETVIMEDPEKAVTILVCLDIMGIKLSIDDFGTGHSSFLYLKYLPIKEIKIDRFFVTDMLKNAQDFMIVNSTIKLGNDSECSVVAEGVEDKETEDELRKLGCDLVQGYYISKPLPFDQITKWLLERKREIDNE